MPLDLNPDLNIDLAFEALFRAEYVGLLRYAGAIFRQRSGDVNISKAEEAVQEMFSLAWRKRDVLFSSEKPVGWLYRALYYTILGILQDERRRAKTLELLQGEYKEGAYDPESPDISLMGIVPSEDFELLKKLYIEGYTYQELAEEADIKKSALAMQVSRIKDKLRAELSKDLT